MISLAAALALAICPPQGPRSDCIVDGDTWWLAGEKFRLAGYDTPELNGRCPEERRLALAARDRLRALLADGDVQWRRTGRDLYGRTVASLLVNGELVGELLVADGLAKRSGARRQNWCPA